ncbi:DEKNAAC103204 [Brettanomyces naardenensis]|uniref:DEKNAAC103204 n=1 Tax=Brettanomyces naardenensis TaxID=13370 RepID=A0A448YMI8_BRENA|nr:DEKNAAC103204 [Brettanomyces naardenensis]
MTDSVDSEKGDLSLKAPPSPAPATPAKTRFRESDAGDGTVREDQILTGAPFYLCVISLILCMFLVALDQMITAAVLSTISNQFHQFNKLTWITAAFMISMGCCAQVWGRLSISFGRKWTLVTGMALFEIGSLISGVSTSMNMFITGRAVQGVGGSCIQTVVMIIATEITTIDKKPMLFAALTLTFMFASVLGPVFGGIFGTYATWRWCFYLNLCFSSIIFPFFIFSYRPKPQLGTFIQKLKTVDFLDNFLMILSFVLILLGISFGTTGESWKTASVICCFTIGGVSLVIFGIWNFKYSKYPVLPRNIVTNVPVLACFFIVTMNYTAMMVLIQFLSIYFQNVIGHNAFHTGLSLIPIAITSCITSIISAIIMKKTRQIKIFSILSAFLLPVSVGLLMLLNTHDNMGYNIGFQILIGISNGLNFQGPAVSAIMNAPKTPGSNILTMAFVNFGRSVGTALFSEIAGGIYTATLKAGIKKISPLIEGTEYPVDEIILKTDLLGSLNTHDRDLVVGKILVSIHDVYWLAFGVSIVVMVATYFMSNAKLPKNEDVEA